MAVQKCNMKIVMFYIQSPAPFMTLVIEDNTLYQLN